MSSIWKYNATLNPSALPDAFRRDLECCPYCSYDLSFLATSSDYASSYHGLSGISGSGHTYKLRVCKVCGWWVLDHVEEVNSGAWGEADVWRSCGSLVQLDLSDIATPTEQLQKYLLAKYDDRFRLDPKKFEDIVAGVFRDFGYCVRTVSYGRPDRGIDVAVLDGSGNDTVGIQVKRYRNAIEAEQIRAFAGALILNGMTEGVYVTTSTFRKGARETASEYAGLGVAIKLWDAADFYQKLHLSRRRAYTVIDDSTAPFFELWKYPEKMRGWRVGSHVFEVYD